MTCIRMYVKYIDTYHRNNMQSTLQVYIIIHLHRLVLSLLFGALWIGSCFQAHSISLRVKLFTTNMVWVLKGQCVGIEAV